LGAFYDEDCTYQAYPNEIDAYNYGDGFPYFYDPILQGNECVSCLQVNREEGDQEENNDENYQYNQYQNNQQYQNYQQQQEEEQNYEANEMCQRTTEEAIKCDGSRGYYSGCYFLQKTLPCLDGRSCGSDSSDYDGEYRGRYDFPHSSATHKSMSQRYYEMVQRVHRNKRIAIAMGALAGGFMLALLASCFWSYLCKPCSPEEQKRREPLLKTQAAEPTPSRSRTRSRSPRKDRKQKTERVRGYKSTNNILL